MTHPTAAFDRPPRVTFHVTDRCPYACKFCFVPPGRDERELPAEPWIAAAQALGRLWPGTQIVLTGGEPILWEGAFALAAAATEAGARVHFNTTGYGIDPKAAARLAAAGVEAVNVSLDGPAAIHNHLRGHTEAFRRASEALDTLAGAVPAVRRNVVTVIMGANLAALPAWLDELESDPRVEGIYLQAVTNPEGPNGSDRWFADPDIWPAVPTARQAAFDEVIARRRRGGKILNPLRALRMQAAFFAEPRFRLADVCAVGEFGFCVDPRGDVSLCGSQPPAGNIARERLEDILSGPVLAEVRAKMKHCDCGCHRQINCATADEKTIPDGI
jgi:MoaA/NifB/PqqE/SkfB family radical SAM enzyme